MSEEDRKALAETIGAAQLPFDEHRQSCFIGHLFNDETRLFRHINGIMSKEWFGDPTHQKIWTVFTQMFAKYQETGRTKLPTPQEIKGSPLLSLFDNETANRIRAYIDKAIEDRNTVRAIVLNDELEVWMHAKILEDAIVRGTNLFNRRKFSEAQGILVESNKKFNASRLLLSDDDDIVTLGSMAEGLGPKNVVPFGIKLIDDHLYPNNPQGGLCKGDQTVLMASINTGKTTTMTTTALHNVRADNFALFIALEGNKHGLRMKFVTGYLTLMDVKELAKIFPEWSPEHLAKVVPQLRDLAKKDVIDILNIFVDKASTKAMVLQTIVNYLFARIRFIPYIKPNMNVEELEPIIERAQDVCMDKHGRGFDLFVCDYPAKLNNARASKGNYQQRQVKQEVYEFFQDLAGQHQWHSLVAIQTNREGSKVNAGISRNGGALLENSERYLQNEDVSEVWGALMGAANVITINRSPADKSLQRVHYAFTKTRTAAVNYVATCYSRFALGISHSDELGGMARYGTSASASVIDKFMAPGESRVVTNDQEAAALYEESQRADEIMAKKENPGLHLVPGDK